MHLLLIALLVFSAGFGLYVFLKRAPKQGPIFLIKLLIGIVLATVIILTVTGRLPVVIGVIAAAVPFIVKLGPIILTLLRFLPFIKHIKGIKQARQRSSGQQSEVTTRYLLMTLDHDTGAVSGTVTTGPYESKTLDELSIDELADLYRHCQDDDPEATRLLDNYFQRHRQQEWEAYSSQHEHGTQQEQSSSSRQGQMTVAEALEVLGLNGTPDRETIIQAHKRMMTKMHPDKGGSNYLATKINQAKDCLLDNLKH